MNWMDCIKLGKVKVIELLTEYGIDYSHIPSGRGQYFKLCSLVHNHNKGNNNNENNNIQITSRIHTSISTQRFGQEQEILLSRHNVERGGDDYQQEERRESLVLSIQRVESIESFTDRLIEIDRRLKIEEHSECPLTRELAKGKRIQLELAIKQREITFQQRELAMQQREIATTCIESIRRVRESSARVRESSARVRETRANNRGTTINDLKAKMQNYRNDRAAYCRA